MPSEKFKQQTGPPTKVIPADPGPGLYRMSIPCQVFVDVEAGSLEEAISKADNLLHEELFDECSGFSLSDRIGRCAMLFQAEQKPEMSDFYDDSDD